MGKMKEEFMRLQETPVMDKMLDDVFRKVFGEHW